MKVIIDSSWHGAANNTVKVAIAGWWSGERHVNITPEGIIVDLIDEGGEVVKTMSITHEEMLADPS